MVLTGDTKTILPEHTSDAFWDIPIYAEHNEARANRIDARLSATRGKKSAQLNELLMD